MGGPHLVLKHSWSIAGTNWFQDQLCFGTKWGPPEINEKIYHARTLKYSPCYLVLLFRKAKKCHRLWVFFTDLRLKKLSWHFFSLKSVKNTHNRWHFLASRDNDCIQYTVQFKTNLEVLWSSSLRDWEQNLASLFPIRNKLTYLSLYQKLAPSKLISNTFLWRKCGRCSRTFLIEQLEIRENEALLIDISVRPRRLAL